MQWRDAAAELADSKETLGVALARWRQRSLTAVLHQWMDVAAAWAQQREALRRGIVHLVHRKLAQALNQWRTAAALLMEGRRARALALPTGVDTSLP